MILKNGIEANSQQCGAGIRSMLQESLACFKDFLDVDMKQQFYDNDCLTNFTRSKERRSKTNAPRHFHKALVFFSSPKLSPFLNSRSKQHKPKALVP